MTEHQVVIFLLALAALLGLARVFGELARMIGLPLVVGEILAGVLLGKSGLSHASPNAYEFLFSSPTTTTMLGAYTTVAAVLLLVVAGLEVDLGIVKRRGSTALVVAGLGMLFPLVCGLGLGHVVPDAVLVNPEQRTMFAVFVGVALSISALPVIAKTLLDLGLFKTDVGLLVMTAAMLDDLVGWIAFSVLLGPMHGGGIDFRRLATTTGLAILFAGGCIIFGRRIVDRILARIESRPTLAPGRVLSLVVVLALLGASVTQAIGLHAVFGGFVIGVTVGDSPRLRERTRQTILQFVTNIFAPVFFASVALRVDFLANFDLGLCLVFFCVATFAKVAGAGLGARLSGLPARESLAVGFGLNARGAMEIILALLGREAGLVSDRVFVAIVTMAIGTSVLAGPSMKRLLFGGSRNKGLEDAAGLVKAGAFLPNMTAPTPARAIEELGHALRPALGDLVDSAVISVLERELVGPTGLGDEVAIPHASVEGLTKPFVALGLARDGVDFDAPDGKSARIVFLVLMPPRAYEREVRVLAALARSVLDEEARAAIMGAQTMEEAVATLDEHARRLANSGRRVESLADIR